MGHSLFSGTRISHFSQAVTVTPSFVVLHIQGNVLFIIDWIRFAEIKPQSSL